MPEDGTGLVRSPLGTAGRNVQANVKRLRAEKRLPYTELSERLAEMGRPIPKMGLAWIESGRRRVDADDLVALAAVFGVQPADLLGPPGDDAEQVPCFDVIGRLDALERQVAEWRNDGLTGRG